MKINIFLKLVLVLIIFSLLWPLDFLNSESLILLLLIYFNEFLKIKVIHKLKYKLIYRVYIYFLVINLILFLIYCFGYLSDSFYLILFLLTLIQCYYLFRNNNVNE
jgi:hypothetical protein